MSAHQGWLLSIIYLVCQIPPAANGETPRRDRYGDPLPSGVRARLGTTRYRIGDTGSCLALSADGTILATGGGSSVRFWKLATGEELRSVKLPVMYVFSVLLSSDSKRFAAVGDRMSMISRPIGDVIDNAVFLGEVNSGKILHEFRGRYTSAFFSPDSKYLFARGGNVYGNEDNPVVVWDAASGKEVCKFPAVVSYALSPDGKVLAGGDKKGIVRLWETNTGAERTLLKGHTSCVMALAFSPDGRTLVSASGEQRGGLSIFEEKPNPRDQSIRVWDVASGKERLRVKRDRSNIRRIRFAPNGETLATEDDDNFLILSNVSNGRVLQRFPGDQQGGHNFVFAPNGDSLIYCGRSLVHSGRETFYQWNIAACKETRRWESQDHRSPRIVFSRDGKTLISLGDALRIWDLATSKEKTATSEHRIDISEMKFSPDSKILATIDDKNNLRMWDAIRGVALSSPLAAQRLAVDCEFTQDRRSLLTVATDTTVSVLESPSGKLVRRFHPGSEATVRLWERILNSGSASEDLRKHLRRCCVFDRERRILAFAGEDQHIHLWDVLRGEELRRLEGHRGSIDRILFSPDSKYLLSQGTDRTIRWWDVAKGEEIQRFQGEGTERGHFALSDDGRMLAWACGERIHLWDLHTRKEVRSLKGHPGGTDDIRFAQGGNTLVSIGGDRAIRYWDATTGLELRAIIPGEYQHTSMNLLAAPDGRVLVHASMDPKHSWFALLDVASGREICRTSPYLHELFAVSPDGKTVVVSGKKLVFREMASGGIVAEMPASHRGRIACLAFSPDGKTLATGGIDTTVLLWDWRRLTGLVGDPSEKIADEAIESLWIDLGSSDSRKAYRAIGALASCGDKAVTLLRQHLRPAAASDWDCVRKSLADLDGDEFAAREKASQELAQLGVEAYFSLRRASAEKVSLEMRRRLELILASPEMKRLSAESLRKTRATQVLDTIGTPAALALLSVWADGAADARLTQEARSTLQRLRGQ